jgi:cyclopropane fatty-acyl-phospholipid synthase-like methyltransferase
MTRSRWPTTRSTLEKILLFFFSFFLIFSTRVREIQRKMSERAIELLALPPGEKLHLLDIGCGSVRETFFPFWGVF